MGDRCTITVRIAKNDEWVLKGLNDCPEPDNFTELNEDHLVEFWLTEMNWGGEYLLNDLQEQGIPYICWNSAGDCYGPGMTIYSAEKDEKLEIDTTWDQEMFVAVNNTGTINVKSQHYVEEFIALRQKIEEEMKNRPTEKEIKNVFK